MTDAEAALRKLQMEKAEALADLTQAEEMEAGVDGRQEAANSKAATDLAIKGMVTADQFRSPDGANRREQGAPAQHVGASLARWGNKRVAQGTTRS